jgi:arsenate reductase
VTTLYGISNCDTVRKARRWLQENAIDYDFHDVRKKGLTAGMLGSWLSAMNWKALLNRRGTTWRQLPAGLRENIDRDSAFNIMLEQPAIIRRPLLEHENQLYLGFSEDRYRAIFRPGPGT